MGFCNSDYGVTEARNGKGEPFAESRRLSSLQSRTEERSSIAPRGIRKDLDGCLGKGIPPRRYNLTGVNHNSPRRT